MAHPVMSPSWFSTCESIETKMSFTCSELLSWRQSPLHDKIDGMILELFHEA